MKSHPLAPVFAMAILLAILLWLCSSCEKPRVFKQGIVYVDPNCHPIIAESGKTYTKWDFDGDSILSGCDILVDTSNWKEVFYDDIYCLQPVLTIEIKDRKK